MWRAIRPSSIAVVEGPVVTGGTTTAARVVELLGGIYSWAEKRGEVAGMNPTRGVETARADPNDRILSAEELKALGSVLAARGHEPAALALRLIALTGLRREEACGLRWREIDIAGQCLRLEVSKTGKSMRPIGKDALSLLEGLPRPSFEWVYPSRGGNRAADLKKQIAALFDAAGLADARSHDLRRTFASIAADLGYSDATIGELLGHARRGVTSRHYIRRPDAALVAAADRVAGHIAAAMAGERLTAGEVINLHSRT
jgi:integrase